MIYVGILPQIVLFLLPLIPPVHALFYVSNGYNSKHVYGVCVLPLLSVRLHISLAFSYETRFVKGILFSKIQFQNHYMNESVLTSGAVSFFIKTYTILVSIAGPFSPLNTLSGIMALQERNEVNNYEHYKCGEKI